MPSQKSARSTTSCVVAVPGWEASPTRTPLMGQPAQRSSRGTGRLLTRRSCLLLGVRVRSPCRVPPQAALSAFVACRLWCRFKEGRCVKPASVRDGGQLPGGSCRLPVKVPNHSSRRSMAAISWHRAWLHDLFMNKQHYMPARTAHVSPSLVARHTHLRRRFAQRWRKHDSHSSSNARDF